MGVYGALFLVGGGEWSGWGIILSGWVWVEKYFRWVEVVGDEWGWVGVSGGRCTFDNALFNCKMYFRIYYNMKFILPCP